MIATASTVSTNLISSNILGNESEIGKFLSLKLWSYKSLRRDILYLSVFSPNAGNIDQNNSEYGHILRSDDV